MAEAISLSIGNADPIGDFVTLRGMVARALDRDDLADDIENLIALAESRFNRTLRLPQMEAVVTADVTAEEFALPNDFLAMRSVFVNSVPRRALSAMSPTQLAETIHPNGYLPQGYTLVGAQPRRIRIEPAPSVDRPLSVSMVYWQRIPALTLSNVTNWLLTEYPDIYYYATLLQSEAYIGNDPRLPVWKAALDEALDELKMAGANDAAGSQPLYPRMLVQTTRYGRA
jgi:hypothetical protein